MGKEVLTGAAGISLGSETAKAAPFVTGVVVGGLTAAEWAYVLAAGYSGLLIIHFVMSKWLLPVIRFALAKRREAKAGAQ